MDICTQLRRDGITPDECTVSNQNRPCPLSFVYSIMTDMFMYFVCKTQFCYTPVCALFRTRTLLPFIITIQNSNTSIRIHMYHQNILL